MNATGLANVTGQKLEILIILDQFQSQEIQIQACFFAIYFLRLLQLINEIIALHKDKRKLKYSRLFPKNEKTIKSSGILCQKFYNPANKPLTQ